MPRKKGSKNKPKPKVVTCECSEEQLIRTAYWWSQREWVFNHAGRESEEYITYMNSVHIYDKEFYGNSGEYLHYTKGNTKKCDS